MGKIIDRVKEGTSVSCGLVMIGEVKRIIKDPDWEKTSFFTVDTKEREILLPIEAIHEASEETIVLGCSAESIEALPDVRGKEVCNQAGYILYELKLKVNEALNLARPFMDYH
ncbi:MAG: hypothetical protein QMD53_05760 [Actinomycetota bacterium]|nr:hypothetical protein [Actinomycetota bacterium]